MAAIMEEGGNFFELILEEKKYGCRKDMINNINFMEIKYLMK